MADQGLSQSDKQWIKEEVRQQIDNFKEWVRVEVRQQLKK
jgi:hypothetical protein